MIRLSRFRRDGARTVALVALVMAASLPGASCSLVGGSCGGEPNCPSGLDIGFAPDALDGGASPEMIDIDIAVPMHQAFVSLVSCSASLTSRIELVCDPGDSYVLWGSDQLHFRDGLGTFRVTVSAAGNQLSQRDYTPSYRTHECVCGNVTTTSASVTVRVPSQEQ
jgi:hypothetical protein